MSDGWIKFFRGGRHPNRLKTLKLGAWRVEFEFTNDKLWDIAIYRERPPT